jgi:hypothetical protein
MDFIYNIHALKILTTIHAVASEIIYKKKDKIDRNIDKTKNKQRYHLM